MDGFIYCGTGPSCWYFGRTQDAVFWAGVREKSPTKLEMVVPSPKIVLVKSKKNHCMNFKVAYWYMLIHGKANA